MINLCLVVIATQFSETKKRETERMIQERKRFHSSSTLASNSEPGGCYDEILKYIAHLYRRAKRKFNRYYKQIQGRRQIKVTPERAISLRCKRKRKNGKGVPHPVYIHHQHHQHFYVKNPESLTSIGGSPEAPRASPEVSDVDPLSSPRRPTHLMLPRDISTNPSAESLPIVTPSSNISDGILCPESILTRQPSTQSSPMYLGTRRVSLCRTPSANSSNSGKNGSMSVVSHGVHGARMSISNGNGDRLHPDSAYINGKTM